MVAKQKSKVINFVLFLCLWLELKNHLLPCLILYLELHRWVCFTCPNLLLNVWEKSNEEKRCFGIKATTTVLLIKPPKWYDSYWTLTKQYSTKNHRDAGISVDKIIFLFYFCFMALFSQAAFSFMHFYSLVRLCLTGDSVTCESVCALSSAKRRHFMGHTDKNSCWH